MFNNNPYLPPYYPAPYRPDPQPPAQLRTINYVANEAEALGVQLYPGESAVFFSSTEPVFFFREIGSDGVPLPLRRCRFEDIPEDQSKPATMADINKIYEMLERMNQNVQNYAPRTPRVSAEPAATAEPEYGYSRGTAPADQPGQAAAWQPEPQRDAVGTAPLRPH